MLPILLTLIAGAPEGLADAAEKPTVEATAQVRVRAEAPDDLDFDASTWRPGSDDFFTLLRTRFGLLARPSEGLTLFVQAQDSRVFGEEPTTGTSIQNVDLHQGYLRLDGIGGAPVSLQLGRMELSYGDQRLIGSFEWSNIGRAFDAARVSAAPSEGVVVDAFYARLHQDRRVPRALGDDFAGIYATGTFGSITVDGYGLYLYDRGGLVDEDGDGIRETPRFPGAGRFHMITPGARLDATFAGALHVNAEAALQLGTRGDLDIFAYAVHAAVGYTLPVATAPKITVGIDHASGDDDPTDDRWGTFENLFPTNHLFYGYLDLASWKNLIDAYASIGFKPHPDVVVTGWAHALARASTDDTFYRASGAPLVPLAQALAVDSRYLGTELDLTVTWKISQHVGTLFGASYLFPGSFANDAFGAGGDDAAAPSLFYAQILAGF